MNNSKNYFKVLFFIAQIFSLAFAKDFYADKDIIWQASTNEFIKYIDQDTSGFGKNDHPVELRAKEIDLVLKSIKFDEQGKNNIAKEKHFKSVLTDQQTNLLGQYLEEGLKEAKPDQDIIFVMEKSVKRFTLLKPARYFVAGRIFYKDNKLNIIMGDYDRLRNEALEAVNDPTGMGLVRYSFDHGKRSVPSTFKKAIINISGVENKQVDNTQRRDWLVIDINVASKSVTHMKKIRKQEEMKNKRKELMEVLDSEDTIHLEATDTPVKITRTIEERLTTLKNLRNKNLITDEEYAQKRMRILDDL